MANTFENDLQIYEYCDGTYYRAIDGTYGACKLLVNISTTTSTPYVIAKGVGTIHTCWEDVEYYRTFEEAAKTWIIKCANIRKRYTKVKSRKKLKDYLE